MTPSPSTTAPTGVSGTHSVADGEQIGKRLRPSSKQQLIILTAADGPLFRIGTGQAGCFDKGGDTG